MGEKKKHAPRLWIKNPSTFRKSCFSLIVLILVLNGISSYPMRNPSGKYVEAVTDPDLEAVKWLIYNVDMNLTIATDRRLGQVVHGVGGFKNVTDDDEIYWLWYHDKWENCTNELNTTNITDKPPISYVFIDNIMYKNGVRGKALVEPRPMTEESYSKFSEYPFVLVYRNQTLNQKKWAEIYWVQW